MSFEGRVKMVEDQEQAGNKVDFRKKFREFMFPDCACCWFARIIGVSIGIGALALFISYLDGVF